MKIIRCDRCNKEVSKDQFYSIRAYSPTNTYLVGKDICEECWGKFAAVPLIPFVDELETKKVEIEPDKNKRKRWRKKIN